MTHPFGPLALSLLALSLAAQPPAKTQAKAKAKPKAPAVTPAVAKSESGLLQVGDPAPSFKVARWVKGGPIASLEKGKAYVVEFWATWCGPCRETIPHLTELAKVRAGKATFIGVDVWERGNDAAALDAKVDAFVQEMGEKMGYAVCRDGADQHMAMAWMKAAGQRGIPAAFIVDKEGRIAHIGHPMEDSFKAALDGVIAGTWDLKAARAAADKAAAEEKAEEAREQARQAAWKEAAPAIQEAVKAKDWAKVLVLADAAEAKHPDLKSELKRPRFQALAATDAPKAQALLDADLAKPTVETCMGTAALLLEEKGLEKRWSEQALALIDKAVALEPRLASRVTSYRFRALLRADAPKAYALFAEGKAKGTALPMAQVLLQEEGVEKAQIEAALPLVEEAAKAPKASPYLHQALASGWFSLGQPAKALASMETFLEALKKAGAPATFLAQFDEELARYKAAVK